jgi:hypothetical protein
MSVARFSALAVLLLAAAACDTGEGTTLYDPTNTGGAAPTIGSISPSGVVLAGVDEIVITGTNFSTTLAENLVYFDDGAGNSAQGTVLEASSTTLRVKTPNLPNAALRLRVAVRGAANFSNAVPFPLEPAFVRVLGPDVNAKETMNGMTSDAMGNLYVAVFDDNLQRSIGIKRVAPDGERTDYTATTFNWADLAFGPDGNVYGARGVRALFRLPAGANQQTVQPQMPAGTVATALSFDSEGRIWSGGNGTSLYRLTVGGAVVGFPFDANVRAVLARPGALYVAGTQGTAPDRLSRVWRFPVDANGDLGTPVVVLDLGALAGADFTPFALAAAADGTLYVATDAPDPLYEVPSGGSARALYPGILPSPLYTLAWGEGSQLYTAKRDNPVTVAVVEEPGLFRVQTRRQGAP